MHQRINTSCKVNKSVIKPNQRIGKNYNSAFALFLHNSVTQIFLVGLHFLQYEDWKRTINPFFLRKKAMVLALHVQ